MDAIYTINARGNIFLEVVRDHYSLTPMQLHTRIRSMFKEASEALTINGISYTRLKSALVPSTTKNEIALLFDTQTIESPAYGREVLSQILPLLDPRTTQSVLVGDMLGSPEHQSFIYSLLRDELQTVRQFEFVHSTLIFCVYLNNLSDHAVAKIINELKVYSAFIGAVPTTYSSPLKTVLSFGLCNLFVKHGKQIILAHEDDRPNSENVNITSYEFEEFGYTVRSIQGHSFSHFLGYKIEREVVPGFQSDTEFSLNAVSWNIALLEELSVSIAPEKLDYLRTQKAGSLMSAGLDLLDVSSITALIRKKLADNYIYNLRYNADHDVILFNIVLQVSRVDGGSPVRLLLALEYQPKEKNLRVVTMY